MKTSDILLDAFGRVNDRVHRICDEATPEDLMYRVDPEANTIAWLLWHTSRVIDGQVMEIAGEDQVWSAKGWSGRFDLPFDESATGYGHSTTEVGHVKASADLLVGYADAAHVAVARYLGGVDDAELDRIVDDRWEPPVTAGVRLVSCIGDGLQHVGQAAYILGVSQRQAD